MASHHPELEKFAAEYGIPVEVLEAVAALESAGGPVLVALPLPVGVSVDEEGPSLPRQLVIDVDDIDDTTGMLTQLLSIAVDRLGGRMVVTWDERNIYPDNLSVSIKNDGHGTVTVTRPTA